MSQNKIILVRITFEQLFYQLYMVYFHNIKEVIIYAPIYYTSMYKVNSSEFSISFEEGGESSKIEGERADVSHLICMV